MKRIKRTPEYYHSIFDREINSGKTITTEDKSIVLEIEDDEVWRQAYSEDSLARKQLPPYWFVSSKGKLISVYKGKCYLIKPEDKCNNSRLSYHMGTTTSEFDTTTKNLNIQNLVGIVFGSEAYGKAKDILNEKGIFAFAKSGDFGVHGHHKDKNKLNNSPDNIQFVTNNSHPVIEKKFTKPDDVLNLMAMAAEQEPEKITLLFKGKDYSEVKAIDKEKLKISEGVQFQMNCMSFLSSASIAVDSVVNDLVLKNGIEYFKEPRYLAYMSSVFFKYQYINNMLEITQLSLIDSELCNKEIIGCYVDKDNTIFYI